MKRPAVWTHARDFGLSFLGATCVMLKVQYLASLGGVAAPRWRSLLIFTVIGFVALKIIDAGRRLVARIRERRAPFGD